MKKTFLRILYILLFIVLGFGIPYLIHIKLNFFGATLVTFKDIVGLWITCPMLVGLLLLAPFMNNEDSK